LVWCGTGFNLFSFTYFVLLPVGAVIMGFIAMTGFYLGDQVRASASFY
jgi:hypothetical protein